MLGGLLNFPLITHFSFERINCAALYVHLLILCHSAATSANNINTSVGRLGYLSLYSTEFGPIPLLFWGLLIALLRSYIRLPAVVVVEAAQKALHFLALGK